MRSRLHSPAIERAAVAYTTVGEFGACWIAVALTGSTLDPGRRDRWLRMTALVPATIAINYCVKRLVARRRPDLDGSLALGRTPSSHSFPSAHAACSFAAAWSAPATRTPMLAAATLMSLTRPYLGLHYPSDVLAGTVLGSAIGIGASSR